MRRAALFVAAVIAPSQHLPCLACRVSYRVDSEYLTSCIIFFLEGHRSFCAGVPVDKRILTVLYNLSYATRSGRKRPLHGLPVTSATEQYFRTVTNSVPRLVMPYIIRSLPPLAVMPQRGLRLTAAHSFQSPPCKYQLVITTSMSSRYRNVITHLLCSQELRCQLFAWRAFQFAIDKLCPLLCAFHQYGSCSAFIATSILFVQLLITRGWGSSNL